MRNIFKISIALLIVSFVAACGDSKKEAEARAKAELAAKQAAEDSANASHFATLLAKPVTADDRRQAATAAGEASYANFKGDFASAEKALARSVAFDPFNADNWFDLGIARIRIKDKSGARAAFNNVLALCKDRAAKDPANAAWLVKQIRPMVILGRVDEARALQKRVLEQFPNDPQVGVFRDPNAINRLLEDALLKEFNS